MGGQARTVPDPQRECEERALTTAIFIAFVLDHIDGQAHRAHTHVIGATSASGATRFFAQAQAQAEVGNGQGRLFVIAPDETVLIVGASLRRQWLGGIAGVTALAPATFDVGTAGARLVRVPVDLGLRGRLKLKQVGLSVDAEAVVVPLFVAGTRVAQALSSHGEDVGGRVAATCSSVAGTPLSTVLRDRGRRDQPPLARGERPA